MDGGVQKLLGVFGVEVSDQLGGVFDVGKADGDLLAFAFQRTAAGADLVGQVLGGVR